MSKAWREDHQALGLTRGPFHLGLHLRIATLKAKNQKAIERTQFALLESALEGRSPISSFFLPRMLQKYFFKKFCSIDEMIT